MRNAGVRAFAEIDLRVSAETVYRPDICAYRAERIVGRVRRLPPSPDLVVEILSPSSKALDLITKRADYERAGVGEYWVVDPETLRFRVWRREGAVLVEVPVEADAATLACGACRGLCSTCGRCERCSARVEPDHHSICCEHRSGAGRRSVA